MGIVERRQREKEQRRQAIISAAEQVFFAKGLEQATVDEVAEAAELSKGTVYLYFKSKEELFLAIHLKGIKIMQKMFQACLQPHQKGLDQVKAIGAAYFDFYDAYPDYFKVLAYYETAELDFEDEESLAAECFQQGNKAYEVLLGAVNKGIQDGSIRTDVDPFKVSLILWGQTTGLILFALNKGELIKQKYNVPTQELFQYYQDFLFDCLKKVKKVNHDPDEQ